MIALQRGNEVLETPFPPPPCRCLSSYLTTAEAEFFLVPSLAREPADPAGGETKAHQQGYPGDLIQPGRSGFSCGSPGKLVGEGLTLFLGLASLHSALTQLTEDGIPSQS